MKLVPGPTDTVLRSNADIDDPTTTIRELIGPVEGRPDVYTVLTTEGLALTVTYKHNRTWTELSAS